MDLDPNNLKEWLVMVEFSQLFWLTSFTKIVALVLGAFIVYLAYNGYKRNSSKPLLYVALGFALITVGTIIEGILYVMVGSELLSAIATGTTVMVLGFVVIIYSIYSVK